MGVCFLQFYSPRLPKAFPAIATVFMLTRGTMFWIPGGLCFGSRGTFFWIQGDYVLAGGYIFFSEPFPSGVYKLTISCFEVVVPLP